MVEHWPSDALNAASRGTVSTSQWNGSDLPRAKPIGHGKKGIAPGHTMELSRGDRAGLELSGSLAEPLATVGWPRGDRAGLEAPITRRLDGQGPDERFHL
jgi:hypothetical protein